MSLRFRKNWLVALSGVGVRAIEMVPRPFLRPFMHSFLMGASVFFWTYLSSKPPPWTTKFGTMRWNVVLS